MGAVLHMRPRLLVPGALILGLVAPGALARDAAYRLAQAAFVAGAFADARTTDLALERGAREGNPVYGAAPSDSRLYGTKAAVVVATLAACAALRKAGHRRAALIILAVGAGLQAAVAAANDGVRRQEGGDR